MSHSSNRSPLPPTLLMSWFLSSSRAALCSLVPDGRRLSPPPSRSSAPLAHPATVAPLPSYIPLPPALLHHQHDLHDAPPLSSHFSGAIQLCAPQRRCIPSLSQMMHLFHMSLLQRRAPDATQFLPSFRTRLWVCRIEWEAFSPHSKQASESERSAPVVGWERGQQRMASPPSVFLWQNTSVLL